MKNILAYCGYSPTSPFFLLLSEHKHCDNTATNSNSENARSRMVASLRRSVGTGTKEDESSTGRVWAAGFHHVSPLWLGARFETCEPLSSLIFQTFFWPRPTADNWNRGYWSRGYEDPPVQSFQYKILWIHVMSYLFLCTDMHPVYFSFQPTIQTKPYTY